jgi:superfamily II DNA or RNA helicase
MYVGLLNKLTAFIKLRGYEVELENFSDPPEQISTEQATDFITTLNTGKEDRDYQLNSFVESVNAGRKVILSPTASGKSLLLYWLIRYYNNTKTLLLVPRTNLVEQMYTDFQEYGFDADRYCHKIYTGREKTSTKPIIISTWQSIYEFPKEFFSDFRLTLQDECHMGEASSLEGIMKKMEFCPYRIGVTGTLGDDSKTHHMILQGLFGSVYKAISAREMIDRGFSASLDVKIFLLSYSQKDRKAARGLSYQEELNFLFTHPLRNSFIINLALSRQGNTLVLFNYIKRQGIPLYDELKRRAKGRKVFLIYGDVKGKDRETIRAIFEKEKDAIIVATFGTFSMGVNIINLHNVILASLVKSEVRFLQSIGRGLRKGEEKQMVTLYDVADDLMNAGDDEINYSLDHYQYRVKALNQEKHPYKLYKINLDENRNEQDQGQL